MWLLGAFGHLLDRARIGVVVITARVRLKNGKAKEIPGRENV
jgi:hypothetical protein